MHGWSKTGALLVVCALVAGGLSPRGAWAGTGDGGTLSPFSLGAGSRAISLGRAFVATADDASAVYWNPAALRNVQSRQIMAMYMPVFGDFTGADYTFFGAVYPTLSAGAFGVGFMRLGTTFDGYDEFSRPTGEANYSESQVLISYAAERRNKWIAGTMATGVSFKIVNQSVDPFSSTAPGLDVGFRYIPDMAKSLSVGVNLQDISGAEHRLDSAADLTYRTTMAGVGYTKHMANGSALQVMLQYDMPERADGRFHAGAEYAFSRFVSLRAGFDDSDISFGLGVKVSAYSFDYAYLTRDEAGTSHPMTFSAGFGATLVEQRDEQGRRRAQEDERLIRQAFENRIKGHREEARKQETAGNWSGALDQWQIVLEYAPGDEEATAQAAAARQRVVAEQAEATRDLETRTLVRTRFDQGLKYYEDHDYLRARSEWTAILAVDSTHAGAGEYLAKTQGKIDEAVTQHIKSARSLEQQNRLTEAIGEWNNVQQYEPDHREARAAIQRIRDRIQSVSRDFEATQERLRIVTLYNDALQYFNDGDYPRTLTNLDELLKLQPDHADARRLRALTQRKMTPLTEQEKQQIRKLYLAGMQYFSKDEYEKAIAEWEKILAIDPSNESVQNNIREARERLKQLEERK
jgi:tetratricopeptide (TPR) repeat protein